MAQAIKPYKWAVTKRGTGMWGLAREGRGDAGTWDVGTRGLGDVGTWERGDVEKWRSGDVGARGRGDAGRGNVKHGDRIFSFPVWTVKYKKTLYLGELLRLYNEENSIGILLLAVRWMLSQRRGFSRQKLQNSDITPFPI